MREVGILEAKTNFSSLVAEVEEGGAEITVTRHGKPVVKIVSAARAIPRSQQNVSGAELARRFRELRERIIAEVPKAAIPDAESVMSELRRAERDV